MYNRYIHGIYCSKDCLATIPHILTTLATGVLITTLLHPLLTQPACGLCAHSSSSHVLCAPPHAKRGPHNKNPADIPLNLLFFSAFEDLRLRTTGTMESNGIRKLCEPSPGPVPTLYVGRVEDLLGRVPLFPCFLHDNATSTISYKYAPRQKQAFEFRCADGASQGSRRGSHVYEINTWLWNFGRPQPRVRGLSVARTERIRRKSRSETSRRAWETRKAHELELACTYHFQ